MHLDKQGLEIRFY